MAIRVTIWHEHRHEKKHKAVSHLYPDGMHGTLANFRPGHETCPTYHDPNVLRIIVNATRWAAPVDGGRVPAGSVNKPVPGWTHEH